LDHVLDITFVLRNALLNAQIMVPSLSPSDLAGEGSVLKVALAISSLDINAVPGGLSDRPVYPITLPTVLDNKEIVSRIWSPAINKERRATQIQALSSNELFLLEIVAATLRTIPRLVEFANQYFVTYACEEIDRALISNLYVHLSSHIPGGCTTNTILHAIVFDEALPLRDPDVKAAITDSILANSIDHFNLILDLNRPCTSYLCFIVQRVWAHRSCGELSTNPSVFANGDSLESGPCTRNLGL